MPPDGWPVILYAHGTGGDYQTFVRESLDLRAALIERKGQPPTRMAMIGIDQVLHGPRDPSGSNAEITFFNLQNLAAARDNVRLVLESRGTTAHGPSHRSADSL